MGIDIDWYPIRGTSEKRLPRSVVRALRSRYTIGVDCNTTLTPTEIPFLEGVSAMLLDTPHHSAMEELIDVLREGGNVALTLNV